MYRLSKDLEGKETDNIIIRVEDGACIPKDESNKDYQEYLKWKKIKGNTPQAAD